MDDSSSLRGGAVIAVLQDEYGIRVPTPPGLHAAITARLEVAR